MHATQLVRKTVRKVLRTVANHDPDYYDMYLDPNEAFFAKLYVEHIMRHAAEAGIRPPVTEPGAPRPARGGDENAAGGGSLRPRLLEAGCQAGRLVVPFAKLGFEVTGIDRSAFALRRAKAHAQAAGVRASFLRGDVVEILRRDVHRQYDLVVCAEVVYLSPHYRQILEALAASVRPGGLLCVSHRSKFFYLVKALQQYDLETAQRVATHGEGPFRGSSYYNWQTEDELRTLYRALGLTWRAAHPIDRVAWLTDMDLSPLTEVQREAWLQVELAASADTTGCGRYLLVIASKPLSKA